MSLAPYDPLLGLSMHPSAYADEIHAATVAVKLDVPSSKLNDYILHYLQPDAASCPITEKMRYKIFKTLLCLGGILGKVPLIPVTFSYEAENRSLAFLGSSLNFIAFSATACWTTIKMTDQILLSFNTTESKQSKSYDRCRKICLTVFNIFNGFTAQIPSLFLTWYYNQDKPYMLGFNALDITFPAYSLNLMMAKKVANFAVTSRQKKISNMKKELIEKIDSKIKALSMQECEALIDEFNHMDYFAIPDLKMNRFLELIHADHLNGQDPVNPCVEDLKRATATLTSYLFLSVQTFWCAFLTYEAMTHQSSNNVFIGSCCLYVVICHIALTRLLLLKGTFRLVNSLPSFCKKTASSYYIADRLSPLSAYVSKFFILFIASASFMQAAKLSEDFLPDAFVFPSTVTFGIGLALMNYVPLRTFAHTLSTQAIARFGSHSQKQQLRVHKTLSAIKGLIENTSLDSFAIFLLKNELHNMTLYYMHKHEITRDDLTEFLKEPPHYYYDGSFEDYGELERRSLI